MKPGPRHAATLVLAVAGAAVNACGGDAPAPKAARPSVDAHAPGWARDGDSRERKAHLFVCQGHGAVEADALASAGALCDDKICKLCGVEVESVLQTDETLTGVELKRQVVERCRMVRTGEPEVTRKSVECGPDGCDAWIQVRYTDAEQADACKRLETGDFAGPEACQATIDAFAQVPGYSAASFRERVRLIDRALVDCARIDVRPTPLMGALDAKLKAGMSIFNAPEADTPGFLKRYWLAPHAPLWTQYEQSPQFVARLKLLRGYLAHKVLLMDVIEAASPEDLDTPQAVAAIARTCAVVPPDEAYGAEHVQLLAAEALYDRFSSGRLTADVSPVSVVLRKQYAPESLQVDAIMTFAKLASVGPAGGRIDADEWAYLMRTRPDGPGPRYALETVDHGGVEVRRQRMREAVARALDGVDAKRRVSRVKNTVPNDGTFFLSVLDDPKTVPEDVRPAVDYAFLLDLYHRSERRMTHAEASAYRAHLAALLKTYPTEPKAAASFCGALADRLTDLDQQGTPTAGVGDTLCQCLTAGMGGEDLTLVNKSALYERALMEGLPCVSPLP